MNILAIGNSFSEDATRYLHGIANADGQPCSVANLCIGGCSLDRHYRNMLSGKNAYELQYNGNNTGFYVSLGDALLNREWDVITLQQASHQSFTTQSYLPYISELAAYARKCSPRAKIYIHQTWAYEADSSRLLNIAKYPTPEAMLSDVVKAYEAAAQAIQADGVIPSGELFAKLLENGVEGIHRDTFHASLGVGRYALGLLWYSTLYKRSVARNGFCDLDAYVSPETLCTVKQCVDSFLKKGDESCKVQIP